MAKYKNVDQYLQENSIVLFEDDSAEQERDDINRKRSRTGAAIAGGVVGWKKGGIPGAIGGAMLGAVAGDVVYRKLLSSGKKPSEAASAASRAEAKRGDKAKAAKYAAKAKQMKSQGK